MLADRCPAVLLPVAVVLAAAGCQDMLPERGEVEKTDPATSFSSDRPVGDDRDTLRELARRIARQHGLDPALVTAVVEVESRWNPRAVSSKGARGLMQLMPGTARSEFGLRDGESLFDPRANLRLGVAHLATLLGRYCDVRLALWAWHAGDGWADPTAARITPRASRRFVDRVLARYRSRGGRPDIVPVEECPSEAPVPVTEEAGPPEDRDAEPEDPDPVVTSAWASALKTRLEEPVDLRLKAENRGGPARAGRLVVTVAERPSLRLGFRSDVEARFADAGRSRGSVSVGRSTSPHPTVTATAERWAPGASHYLHLRLVPSETGTIILYYRFTLEGTDGTLHHYPEPPSNRPAAERGRRVEIEVTRTLTGGNR